MIAVLRPSHLIMSRKYINITFFICFLRYYITSAFDTLELCRIGMDVCGMFFRVYYLPGLMRGEHECWSGSQRLGSSQH